MHKANKLLVISAIMMIPLASCGGNPSTGSISETSSEQPSSSITKTYVDGMELGQGLSYTGYVDPDQIPFGEGEITYQNGDILAAAFPYKELPTEATIRYRETLNVFSGTIRMDDSYMFDLTNGKYAFPNGQYYKGGFVDGLYEDDNGIFSYHTTDEDGTITYGYVYQGAFEAGSYIDLIGSL